MKWYGDTGAASAREGGDMGLQKIGFIGLGLIGGSIAMRLRRERGGLSIIAASGHESTIRDARAMGLIDNDAPCGMDDFADCDYVFLCAPVQKNMEYLSLLKGRLSNKCIVTDVGSVKADIHRLAASLGMESKFIGGHPMAGSEKTGLMNARADLLDGAYYIITPTASVPPKRVEEFKGLVSSLGAVPMVLDYERHDYAVAAISHLPHLIAYSLVDLIRERDDADGTMRKIAAGGFKDITRIASSSPVMWENICLSNREQLLLLLDDYMERLGKVRAAVERRDANALLKLFSEAKEYRDSM